MNESKYVRHSFSTLWTLAGKWLRQQFESIAAAKLGRQKVALRLIKQNIKQLHSTTQELIHIIRRPFYGLLLNDSYILNRNCP